MKKRIPEDTAPKLEILSSRFFPVSPAELYRTFSDPGLLQQWWGPKGFTNTFQEFDLRPGGKWKFIMHGPNGTDYPNEKTFVEVSVNKRIIFDHSGPIHKFTMTIDYETAAVGTNLSWKMVFYDGPENEKFKDFIHEANEQNFDRLEAILSKPETGS